uniref:Hexosyltransferase n=1 Tax=Plectus sambesii TaxID=2011161 RepID=A0A914WWF0_9BILA
MHRICLNPSRRCRNLLVTVIVCSIAAIYVLDITYGVLVGSPQRRSSVDFRPSANISSSKNFVSQPARPSLLKYVLRRPSLQPFIYHFEPHVCTKRTNRSTLVAVIYVASGISDEDRHWRSVVRATWAKSTSLSFSVVFLLGIPKRGDPASTGTLQALAAESLEYGDLLVANFEDRFNHLIYKWWAQVYYHGQHCAHVPFFAWTDSDTAVLTENLIALLRKHRDTYTNAMGCLVMSGVPIRDPANTKYYLSFDLWPHATLPRYCSGVFQLISTQAARRLAGAVPKMGLDYILAFGIFDVATGLVAALADVRMLDLPGVVAYPPVENICGDSLIALHASGDELLVLADGGIFETEPSVSNSEPLVVVFHDCSVAADGESESAFDFVAQLGDLLSCTAMLSTCSSGNGFVVEWSTGAR